MKTFDEIRNLIAPVLELYHVKSAYLFGSYARGELEQDGIAYKIQAIAESLGKVSQDFKDSHTEIPWKNSKGMRNQLSHNYGQNNYRLIWSTYKEKLPELRE